MQHKYILQCLIVCCSNLLYAVVVSAYTVDLEFIKPQLICSDGGRTVAYSDNFPILKRNGSILFNI
jgi:hypothetical protein